MCRGCPLRRSETLFGDDFAGYVNSMTRLWMFGQAGFPIGDLDLSSTDWRVIAEIARWHHVKDIEATIPRAQ